MMIFNTTGKLFPWIYSRKWISDNQLQVDILSPNDKIKIGDHIELELHDRKMTVTLKVKFILSVTDAPGNFQDKSLKENSYYKLILEPCDTQLFKENKNQENHF